MKKILDLLFGKPKAASRICPFHKESTPSMMVQNGRYHCLSCGRRGLVGDL